ncbi:hypothetical protein [Subtercola lobariae]|uniref:hypothetical protein n=1 Tax=Subtercola lobariae TaxID=1588641 RepID=UPI00166B1B10|nr:hypothetical protein [Subtercola lobariae]
MIEFSAHVVRRSEISLEAILGQHQHLGKFPIELIQLHRGRREPFRDGAELLGNVALFDCIEVYWNNSLKVTIEQLFASSLQSSLFKNQVMLYSLGSL